MYKNILMNNKLTSLFATKNKNILNIYCTAGYPNLQSTTSVIEALQASGVDIVEVGMPYSDPIADGPVIQQSNMIAIENGMTISILLEQLHSIKNTCTIPIVLMGYLNPVLQYGIEKFCTDAANAGVAGIIIPDLPMYEYETMYAPYFTKNLLSFIFLITPETSLERIKKADAVTTGFLYAVSSNSTTGSSLNENSQQQYFEKISNLSLKNNTLIGFGINSHSTFTNACKYAAGAIIGSAFIQALSNSIHISETVQKFVSNIKGNA